MTNPSEPDDTTRAFEELLAGATDGGQSYVLRLFVSGMTPRSMRAVASIRKICEEHLQGRYELEVVDIYQSPHLAREDQVIAAPTLIKSLPEPLRRLIGDLSDTDRVLQGLDLAPKS